MIPPDLDRNDDDDPLARMAREGGATIINLQLEAGRRAEREEKKRQQDKQREEFRRQHNPNFDDLVKEVWTEERLANTTFPPVQWLVQDLISTGVWLCSAPPKMGKSFLVTQLCQCHAAGTMFCNYKPTTKGVALYLDLEGKPRRAAGRQQKIRGGFGVPSPDFHSLFKFPPMNPGGEVDGTAELEKFIVHLGLTLVVVDIWTHFRMQKGKGEDAYTYDYRSITPLIELANKHSITIILVHHNRKQADLDWMAEASGSTGLTGAVDGTMGIKLGRGENTAIFNIAGREVEPQSLAMDFNGGVWNCLGDANEYFAGEHRKKVHGVLALPQNVRGIALKDLVEECDPMRRQEVERVLRKMRHEGIVNSPKRGWYVLVNPTRGTAG